MGFVTPPPDIDEAASAQARVPSAPVPPLAKLLLVVAGLALAALCVFTVLMPANAAVGTGSVSVADPHGALVLPAPNPLSGSGAIMGRTTPSAGPASSGQGGGGTRATGHRTGTGGTGGTGRANPPTAVPLSPEPSPSPAPTGPQQTSPAAVPPSIVPTSPVPAASPNVTPSAPEIVPKLTIAPSPTPAPSPSPSTAG